MRGKINVSVCSGHELANALYVCVYLLIGKGQSAQKRPYWGEDRIKRKNYE